MLHQIRGRKRRASNLFLGNDSPGLGLGVAPTEKDPITAPASDFFHYFTPNDDTRLVKNVPAQSIQTIYTAQNGAGTPLWNFGATPAIAPFYNGATINGLQTAFFQNLLNKRWAINPTIPASGEFAYPSMTWFVICQPQNAVTNQSFIISDYGAVLNQLVYLKIGNGVALEVSALMRDAGANVILALSGATVLSLNTTYLLVAKLDGTNRRIDLWIDGGVGWNNTNGAYTNTNTWEGKATASSVPTVGLLSNTLNNPFVGLLGSMFLTKTALSNADINLYANFLATQWGTTWTDI